MNTVRREMIYVQYFYDNFFFRIYIMFLFHLSIILVFMSIPTISLEIYGCQLNGCTCSNNTSLVRSMVSRKNVSNKFWSEAMKWATYILNMSHALLIKYIIPEEAWSGIKPCVHLITGKMSVITLHLSPYVILECMQNLFSLYLD